jgi:thiol:disulfide interchange protein DsbD
MPCVLPVLAIKVLGFAQHSRQHHAHRVAGLAYTVGVLVSFLALGAAVLALRAAGEQLGWGFQLQSPWVVTILAALFTLIALNLFGMFDLGHLLPQSLATLQARHPVVDATLSGVLAVAVASPCTAPFMGASLGLAMTLPTWQALSIFAAMGLGLAAPYLLASWLPAVARRLPHPGPWMITLRQLLGFPMLATVAWLLWVLGQQTSLDATMAVLGGLLLLAASVWARQHPSRITRILSAVLALMLVIGTVQLAPLLTEPSAQPNSSRNDSSNNTWQPWSEVSIANALQDGRPVFVDFTAAWCVTCQINKKATLSNVDVMADFAAHQVTLLRADWTRRDPAITNALTGLGRSGVPVYVLYAPNHAPVVLSELLSPAQIHDALQTLPTAQKP